MSGPAEQSAGRLAGRLAATLDTLRRNGRKALASFITAGDPAPAATVPALHALVRGGVDILELGIPFSDPEAEGPVIQAASERALAAGMTLRGTLALVTAFRRDDDRTPVVLMGYLNSVLAMGCEAFAAAAAAAGVDGLIMVNLPPEEANELKSALDRNGISLIFLVAPTTTEARAGKILEAASGFVYYVSLKGITGADHLDTGSAAAKLRWLKTLTDLPVMVGFGIKDGASAAALGRHADGVVVGAALVAAMNDGELAPAAIAARLEARAGGIRAALDALPR